MQKIGLATCSKRPQLTDDDQLLLNSLGQDGVSAQPVVWDDREVNWQEFSCIVIRSCWDYHTRLDEFLKWLDLLEKQNVAILNPADMIRWNCNKRYLLDIEAQGVSLVPTVFLQKNSAKKTLKQLLKDLSWKQAVVKPTVSATAYQTWLTSFDNPESDQIKLEKMLTEFPEVMIQQFLEIIRIGGEWSFLFFDGCFSHAVVKKPQAGDFRVQDDFGGTAFRQEPGQHLINQAEAILQALDEVPLYARVDGIEIDGKLMLMELELIEPVLFLAVAEGASNRFAKAITQRF